MLSCTDLARDRKPQCISRDPTANQNYGVAPYKEHTRLHHRDPLKQCFIRKHSPDTAHAVKHARFLGSESLTKRALGTPPQEFDLSVRTSDTEAQIAILQRCQATKGLSSQNYLTMAALCRQSGGNTGSQQACLKAALRHLSQQVPITEFELIAQVRLTVTFPSRGFQSSLLVLAGQRGIPDHTVPAPPCSSSNKFHWRYLLLAVSLRRRALRASGSVTWLCRSARVRLDCLAVM